MGNRNSGIARYDIHAALLLSMFVIVMLGFGYVRNSQTRYYGVLAVQEVNAFSVLDIQSGDRSRLSFCANERIPWYSGYVVKDLRIHVSGDCLLLDDGIAYKIVRGNDAQWESLYPGLTKEDGPNRPVLANNCNNTPDDKDVTCDGGEAVFFKENANAEPARSVD